MGSVSPAHLRWLFGYGRATGCRSSIVRRSESSAGSSVADRDALAFAELDPPDLAGERLRKIGHELDAARVRVGGEPLAHEPLDLLAQFVGRLVAVGEDDGRLHDVAPQFAGRGDGCGFPRGWMLEAG